MSRLTPEGQTVVADIAARHGVSPGAVETLLAAVANGHGTQAQFDHPELGGMGQWSAGGMTMVGDMFNHVLKARVDALCSELAGVVSRGQVFAPAPRSGSTQGQAQGSGTSLFVAGSGLGGDWWAESLGVPSSTGTQNSMRYAVFPETRRLAIGLADRVEVFDTGDHRITGVSQQQSGDQSLTFQSQHGLVRIADLPKVTQEPAQEPGTAAATARLSPPGTPAADPLAEETTVPRTAPSAAFTEAPKAEPANRTRTPLSSDAQGIVTLIRNLADLRDAGILTDAEFEAKKSELLARL